MARAKRIYFNNAVYHICLRGNNRQFVLRDKEDKAAFLESVEKFRARFAFRVFCLTLMDNHVHLILNVASLISISKIMHAIALSYSMKFRRKYGYTGYVWQGRFKSNVIEGERYILECIEYIHNNPVRAKMVEKAEDYPWSSCRFYSGLGSEITNYLQLEKFKAA